MKKFSTLLFILFTAFSLFAQTNLLNQEVYGFETPVNYYNQASEYLSLTADQVAVGDSSLRIHCDDYANASDAWQFQIASTTTAPDSAKFTLPAGDYYVSLKVYLDGDAPLKFSTNITDTAFFAIVWDLQGVETGKWVTLSQKISLADVNSKMSIKVIKGQRPDTGAGTLYVDDITVVKDEYEMEVIEGNYLDTYYYGFESGSDAVDGLFIPNAIKDYISFSTEMNDNPMGNAFALRLDVPSLIDVPKYEKNGKMLTTGVSIQLGDKEALNGVASAILPQGEYTASINVFMDERNISSFTTPFNDNSFTADIDEWLNVVWTVPSDIALGEWVTLTQKITLDSDMDTKVTFKFDQKDLVDTTENAVFYIDDYAFIDYVEEIEPTDGYKVGNVLDEDYMGFELLEAGWFPQTNAGAGYFSFVDEKAATGTYSMKLTVPAGDASVPDNLKVQGKPADNPVVMAEGIYDLYIKVWIDANSTINAINTNYSPVGDGTGEFKAVVWDLKSVAKDQWVELHQIDTFPAYTNSKLVVQTKSDSLDFSTNDVIVYFDDIAAVFKNDYVAAPEVTIVSPKQDSVSNSTSMAIDFTLSSDFVLGTDGKLMYSVNGATAVEQTSTAAIALDNLTEETYQVVLEIVDMLGASFVPAVSDTVDFSIAISSSINDDSASLLSIYPNPANDQIFIEAQLGSLLTIYSVLGTVEKTMIISQSITSVDVSDMNPGTYFVQLNDMFGTSTSTFIVK